MEFVTIHNLSRELNIPARVIRYRLIHLIAEGKLKEHEDFRREDFKDDLHFVFKMHPLRFYARNRFQARECDRHETSCYRGPIVLGRCVNWCFGAALR